MIRFGLPDHIHHNFFFIYVWLIELKLMWPSCDMWTCIYLESYRCMPLVGSPIITGHHMHGYEQRGKDFRSGIVFLCGRNHIPLCSPPLFSISTTWVMSALHYRRRQSTATTNTTATVSSRSLMEPLNVFIWWRASLDTLSEDKQSIWLHRWCYRTRINR